MKHRVAVTGLGVVSSIGRSVGTFTESLLAGRSGAGPIRSFDPASLATRIAAEVPLEPHELAGGAPDSGPLAGRCLRDRKIHFGLDAARQAMAAAARGGAGLARDPAGGYGVSLGIGLELFELDDMVARRRPGFIPPAALGDRLTFLQTPSDLVAHLIGLEHALTSPPRVHISACAAGADAIGDAYHLVASGRRRWMLAGGTDSMINPMAVAGFCKLYATTTRNDAPERASRPFDRGRDGFLLGEGAAFLVLERWHDAVARGAHVHGEILGYGNSFDAHGITEPHPEGRGALQAMQRALADAGLGPDDIDAINAHGTSTPKNDPVETLAIRRLLGDRARDVPISATKSLTGHLIAAAGAIEAVAALVCIERQTVHPTLNLEDPDPACDLDYVPGHARAHPQRHVLSNSFGFGGQNAALVFGRSPL